MGVVMLLQAAVPQPLAMILHEVYADSALAVLLAKRGYHLQKYLDFD